MKLSELQLLSGNDIPFEGAQICLHPPTIKEIGLIGEETFFTGCELLKFSKNILNSQDKINLANFSDFYIFMSIMNDVSSATKKNVEASLAVLTLLFPAYEVKIDKDKIYFIQGDEIHCLTENNFEQFKDLIVQIFCLGKVSKEENYNPSGELAKRIAEKLARGRQQAAAAKNANSKISILNRYVSILAVGETKDMNELLNYTIYQLFDEFHRFELKETYDQYVQAKLAGCKDLKEPENWMKDLYDDTDNKGTQTVF